MKYAAVEKDGVTVNVVYYEFNQNIQEFEAAKGRSIVPVTDDDLIVVSKDPDDPDSETWFELKDPKASQVAALLKELDTIDNNYNSDRTWREYVLANTDLFSTEGVQRIQTAEDKAQAVRDQLKYASID